MALPSRNLIAACEGGVSSLRVVKVPLGATKLEAADRSNAVSIVGRGLDRGSTQGVIVALPSHNPVIILP